MKKDKRFGSIKRISKIESIEKMIDDLKKEKEYYNDKISETYYTSSKDCETYAKLYDEVNELLGEAYKKLIFLNTITE